LSTAPMRPAPDQTRIRSCLLAWAWCDAGHGTRDTGRTVVRQRVYRANPLLLLHQHTQRRQRWILWLAACLSHG
jgi:hypothetical protein